MLENPPKGLLVHFPVLWLKNHPLHRASRSTFRISSTRQPLMPKQKQTFLVDFWILWEKARVGFNERISLKHVYYQGWNRLPAQVGCMRQVLRAGALGRPRGMGWGGRWEGGCGWGTHVNPWLIHVNVWQKPLQYCKVISLQLIKINENICI